MATLIGIALFTQQLVPSLRCYIRSPWSNKYDPPIDGGATPSGELRKMEVQANEVFDIYRELYDFNN